VEPRQIIGSGITASAIAHLSILMVVIFFAEVHPFGTVTAETIAVDIVSPEEVAEFPKPLEPPVYEIPPKPEIQIPLPSDHPSETKPASAAKSAAAAPPPPPAPPPAAAREAAAQPQKQAALTPQPAQQQPPQPAQQQAAPQPPPPPPQPASASPLPPAIPQEPDVSVKYHVLLGLPAAPGDDFDAPASKSADIASGFIAEFRRHLKTCAKLPASISPSDDIKIKLRVSMTPAGKLSADPVLIEASASMKGPLLMRGAIDALEACQPYAMLPSDKYGEWKKLDLIFTPQDFSHG
jgi:outer membrane biosynthesis protein TonB